MDYKQTSETIKDIIKSATPANSNTSRFSELDGIDKNRESIVSHLKHGYSKETEHILTSKEFEYASKDYKNMIVSSEGELGSVQDKVKQVEKQIKLASDELTRAEANEQVLKVLAITVSLVAVLYFIGSGHTIVHFFALLVLVGGFLFAIHLNNTLPQVTSKHKPEFPHNNNKWWTSTTPEQ